MRNFYLLLTLTLFLLGTCSVFNTLHATETKKLRIGFIAPFSGPAQIYGEAARNGFELALEELGNDWVDVIYEDDQFLPAKTVAAFHKLTSRDQVDLVITVGSTPSKAVAPLAQSKVIPLIAWASDRQVSKGRSQVIRSYPSGAAEGQAAALEARRRGYNKIALLSSVNDYAQSWKRGLQENLSDAELLVDEDLMADLRDFRSLIVKIRKSGAQQVALCLDPGNSGVFAKQLREFKLSLQIFGCEYLHDQNERELAGGALTGAWFVTIRVTDEFHERYLKKFKNDSVISGAANHYDLLHLLHDTRSSSENTGVIDALLKSSRREQAAVGPFSIKTDEGDTYFDIPLAVKELS